MGETPEVYSKYASELHAHWQNLQIYWDSSEMIFPFQIFQLPSRIFGCS